MPDWAALQQTAMSAAAADTADVVKRDLPIAYVLEANGVPVSAGEGKLQAVCPFHDDHSPSLDIYGEGEILDRFGCYPCGAGGDVLDLIGKLYDMYDFPAKMRKAKELMADMPADWQAPRVVLRPKVFDLEIARSYVNKSQSNDIGPIVAFLATIGDRSEALQPVHPEWLRAEFRIGTDAEKIVIPYYDTDGELIAYKYRTAQTKAIAAAGATLQNNLYGEWRDTDPSDTVVLCEGESDVWAASFHLPDGYVALGLPTGTGTHPVVAPRFAGRKVIIAFDGDDAGRQACLRWSVALRAEGADVYIAPLPDGLDIASMERPGQYLTTNRPLMPAPDSIVVIDDVYMRPNGDLPVPLSNWSIDPEVELLGPEGQSAYEGTLNPSGRRVTISSFDLASKSAIVSWSLRNGGAWYGTDRDAQQLLGLLQSTGPFLSPGAMATVAGLHDQHFVLPGSTIGPDHWKYVAPPNDVHLESRITIAEGDWASGQVGALRDLHAHRVTDPILAWLAIAPLRSLFRQFPILAVTGSSGTGKTTLMETILGAFTGSVITTNLTSTTPHALFSFVGCSNALPVWFDEYRPGARRATLETLQQVIRDAYTGQSSSKGGMGQSWAEVTSVSAGCPLIITGEDAFQETSHTERMVMVDLPIAGRNPEMLEEVVSWGDTGLPYAYLSWLQWSLMNDALDLRVPTDVALDLPPRQRANFGMLALGWRILNQFLEWAGDCELLGDPDWSMVLDSAGEATQHNPIKDAILWCLDEKDSLDFMLLDPQDDWVHIRLENFVTYVKRNSSFTLPGGPEAIRRYLVNHYGAVTQRRRINSVQARVVSFPASMLESGL